MQRQLNITKKSEDLMDCGYKSRMADWRMDEVTESDIYDRYADTPKLHYKISHLLQRLPEEEQAVLDLFYIQRLPQREIALRLSISQSSVSNRLRNAKNRLKFLVLYEPIRERDIDEDLKDFFGKIDRSIIKLMMRTTSLTKTLEQVQCIFPEWTFSFTTVRYSWAQAKSKMKRWNYPFMARYVKVMDFISDNYCILSNYYFMGEQRREGIVQRNGGPGTLPKHGVSGL